MVNKVEYNIILTDKLPTV